MNVPVLDLKRQYQPLYPQIFSAIQKVVESGGYILGPELEGFETELGEWLKSRYVIGVTSGTDALFLGLRAVGVGPGDHVLTSPFTFFATVSAICNLGAIPVFADIDPKTFNLDAGQVEAALKKDTARKIKAIVPVHLYGLAADMPALVTLADKYHVSLIEDACQAIGGEIQGKKTGNWGHVACFSLYPTKNLGAFGDAGFLTTQDGELAKSLRMLRVHGQSAQYVHDKVGSNFRMDAMQAAILRVLLPHLEGWIGERRNLAEAYNHRLAGLEGQLDLPVTPAGFKHAYHQYTVRVGLGKRSALRQYLSDHKIGSAVYYPVPCHLQKALSGMGYAQGDFPQTEKACEEVLSLPVFPGMTSEEQEAVVSKVLSFCAKR